ncbi:unnamed protein product [Victoria cruziana]
MRAGGIECRSLLYRIYGMASLGEVTCFVVLQEHHQKLWSCFPFSYTEKEKLALLISGRKSKMAEEAGRFVGLLCLVGVPPRALRLIGGHVSMSEYPPQKELELFSQCLNATRRRI